MLSVTLTKKKICRKRFEIKKFSAITFLCFRYWIMFKNHSCQCSGSNQVLSNMLLLSLTFYKEEFTAHYTSFSFAFSEVRTFRSLLDFCWLTAYILQILLRYFFFLFISVGYTLIAILWKHRNFSFITFSSSYNPNLAQRAGRHHCNN